MNNAKPQAPIDHLWRPARQMHFTHFNSEDYMWGDLLGNQAIFVECAVYDRAPEGQRCYPSYWLRRWKTCEFEDPENNYPSVYVRQGRLTRVPHPDRAVRTARYWQAQMAAEARRSQEGAERFYQRRMRRAARPPRTR